MITHICHECGCAVGEECDGSGEVFCDNCGWEVGHGFCEQCEAENG